MGPDLPYFCASSCAFVFRRNSRLWAGVEGFSNNQKEDEREQTDGLERCGLWALDQRSDPITVRGARLLAEADIVLHDALSHPDLLELAPDAVHVDVGKRYGQRATPQDDINLLLLKYAKQYKRIVRLKGGDPIIFARGSEEALTLARAGVEFEIVPAITSAIAASGFAGIPLTHRDLSSR